MWYILQLAVIILVVNYCVALHTDASVFAIYLSALFVAYIVTVVLTFVFDLLTSALRLLGGGTFRTNTLLSQQSRDHPRIHVAKQVLPRSTPEKRPGTP